MKKSVLQNKKSILIILSLTIFFLFLDQFTKTWAINQLSTPIQFAPWFQFSLEKNFGIAFSIAIPFPLLIILNLAFFAFLIIYLFRQLKLISPFAQLTLSLLSAGAIGNLLDRIRLGFVIDFISIGQFPVFNLADSYITVSVFLLLFFYDKINRSN